MKIINTAYRQNASRANAVKPGKGFGKHALLFLPWIVAGYIYSPAAVSQENGVLVSHNIGFNIGAQVYPEVSDDDNSPDAETLIVNTTLWGHQQVQPEHFCQGYVNLQEAHPRCPWSPHSSDIQHLNLQYTAFRKRSGTLAHAEISAQITDMNENEFRVVGQYHTKVQSIASEGWHVFSVYSWVEWGMLVTIKRPMKVFVSNCSIFDIRFLPVQYHHKGRDICTFEIKDVDKYDVSLPVPSVGSAVPDVELPTPESGNMPEMDEESMKALMGQLEALGEDLDGQIQWMKEQMAGNGEANDEIWSEPGPNDEIWQQAQAPALTPEQTGAKLESLPAPPADWIPADFVEDKVTAENHESYEKRRAGDPEALAEQQEFIDWLQVMNQTTSGRQLIFLLDPDESAVSIGSAASDGGGKETEKSERFAISIRPL